MNIFDEDWKGYTIDELRIRRMVTLTRIEIAKAKLEHAAKPITDKKEMLSSMPVLRKLTGALDYFDYAMIAYKLGSRVIKMFRRRK